MKDLHRCPQCGHNLNREDEERMRCPECKYDWRKNITSAKPSEPK